MRADARGLRILVIAPVRYPIAQPHAGGLESALWHHVRLLRERGHRVTLCAVEGSDFMDDGPAEMRLPVVRWPDGAATSDEDYPPGFLPLATRALDGALRYAEQHSGDFDVIDNHCLLGLPLAWEHRIGLPMVTTLHTPVLPEIVESSDPARRQPHRFVSVSTHTAGEWSRAGVRSTVVPNAVDTARWLPGPGGHDLVWFGRIVPEKGPHLAIRAARRLGRRIVLAGRVGDRAYAEREVWPLLDDRAIYAGPLRQSELAELVGRSACALITPIWDEPFGLVIAEALSTGTPVAAFDTGGVAEVVAGSPGAQLAGAADVAALADAADALIARSTAESRAATRQDAALRFSLDARMLRIESLYRRLIDGREADVGTRRHPPLGARPAVRSLGAPRVAVSP